MNRLTSIIKFKKFDKYVYALVVIVIVSRFLTLAYPSIDSLFQYIGIIASILSFALVFKFASLSRFSFVYLFLILLMLFSQYVYTAHVYNQSLYFFFSASFTYIYCLLFFSFVYLFKRYGVETLLRKLQYIALIIASFMIIAAIIKNVIGVSLIEAMRERSGTARLAEPEIVDVEILFSFWSFFKYKWNKKDFLVSVICIAAIFCVSQTRVIEIVLIACSCVLLFSQNKGANKKFYVIAFICIVSFSLVESGVASTFIDSFSLSGQESDSTIARIREVTYYMSLFADHPVMGIGMIAYNSPLHYLISGRLGNYYIEDVGIIGALGTIGLWIVPLFLVPVIFFIKKVRYADNELCPLYISLIFYTIGTSLTLLIVYPFLSPVWPMLIAMFDVINRKKI